jgi:hypothetical protein
MRLSSLQRRSFVPLVSERDRSFCRNIVVTSPSREPLLAVPTALPASRLVAERPRAPGSIRPASTGSPRLISHISGPVPVVSGAVERLWLPVAVSYRPSDAGRLLPLAPWRSVQPHVVVSALVPLALLRSLAPDRDDGAETRPRPLLPGLRPLWLPALLPVASAQWLQRSPDVSAPTSLARCACTGRFVLSRVLWMRPSQTPSC